MVSRTAARKVEKKERAKPGVSIVLMPGTPVPRKIHGHKVWQSTLIVGGKKFPVANVEDATAIFYDTIVSCRVPYSCGSHGHTFRANRVIEIRNFRNGRVKERNLKICPQCFKRAAVTSSRPREGKVTLISKCTKCNHITRTKVIKEVAWVWT